VPSAKKTAFSVACFGEVLWDVLPRGIFLGGAPINVAYHLTRLGIRALPISAVGRDFLGDEALRRISSWPTATTLISRDRGRPTGIVRAVLDAHGAATYRIAEQVAWDRIEIPRGVGRIPAPRVLVYGSLALRGMTNRIALMHLTGMWPDTLRVLDLNLRSPFHQGENVAFALRYAQLVKLNDEELQRCTELPVRTERELEKAARRFAAKHRVPRLCVTAGARGAGLLWDDTWAWEPGRPVAVRDTIGAGDAFLAGFLAACFARQESPRDALARACRLGEFVAAHDGATPAYDVDARGRPVAAGGKSKRGSKSGRRTTSPRSASLRRLRA
jgi:fructokinase